jgi:hypothetical protein
MSTPKRQKAKQHNAKKTKGQTTQRQKEIGQKNTTPKRQKTNKQLLDRNLCLFVDLQHNKQNNSPALFGGVRVA